MVPVHCEYETGNDIAIGPGANAGYSCILAGKGLRAAAGGERKCEGWAGEYTKVATVRPASELAAHKPRCCAGGSPCFWSWAVAALPPAWQRRRPPVASSTGLSLPR